MHHAETAVFDGQDVVGQVCRLLGRLLVLRVPRRIFHIVRAAENPHQGRHQAVDRLGQVAADHLAAAVFLVAKRLAQVVVGRLEPLSLKVGVLIVQGAFGFLRDKGRDVSVVEGHYSSSCMSASNAASRSD